MCTYTLKKYYAKQRMSKRLTKCSWWWEYLSHRYILFVVFSSFMTYSQTCSSSDKMDETSGTWSPYTSVACTFILDFSGVRVVLSLAFCVVFCRSLFLILSIFIFWSLNCVLRFTTSKYAFSIFSLLFSYVCFFYHINICMQFHTSSYSHGT